jgi:phosphotriesterase-related protein
VRLSVEKNGVERMAELFVREIREGMEDPAGTWGERFTDVRAGIIKVATSTYLRPSERRIHEAAAAASAETNCPITTHTTDGGGLEQAQVLIAAGARPERIVIGHQGYRDDRTSDEADDYHLRIAELGCSVQFDRVGHERYPVPSMARQIQRLLAAGHRERVLVGHDHVPFLYDRYASPDKPADGWQARDVDFTVIPRQLTAALREAGASDDDLRAILVGNPARLLAF